MKQNMLQMLISAYGNVKKLKLFINLIIKFIKKFIGVQKHGKRRWNLSRTVCGILYYLKSGCQWRLLPSEFGKWRTIYGWYGKFCKMEIFKHLWKAITVYAAENKILKLKDILCDGSLVLTVSPVSIKRKNPRMKNKNCINRLLSTDRKGAPIALLLANGTAHDSRFLIPLIDQIIKLIELPKQFVAHADKGFDSVHNRWEISNRRGYAEIPIRNHGFTTEYPKSKDVKRQIVEHAFAWVNSFKALKTIATKLLKNIYENHFFVFSIITTRFFNFKNIKTLTRII
jgi:Putative transposase of IS4/5 family (DUF4096)